MNEFYVCCTIGFTGGVRAALADPNVDPGKNDNDGIILASSRGHVEIVRVLLADPRVDPSARNNIAIKWACFHNLVEVVRLLLQDPRVDASDIKSSRPEIREMLAQWKYHPR